MGSQFFSTIARLTYQFVFLPVSTGNLFSHCAVEILTTCFSRFLAVFGGHLITSGSISTAWGRAPGKRRASGRAFLRRSMGPWKAMESRLERLHFKLVQSRPCAVEIFLGARSWQLSSFSFFWPAANWLEPEGKNNMLWSGLDS